MVKLFLVKIRRDLKDKIVRAESEMVDGKTYKFTFGWEMGDGDPYPGEQAWIPCDDTYPKHAPLWISSGDLVPIE